MALGKVWTIGGPAANSTSFNTGTSATGTATAALVAGYRGQTGMTSVCNSYSGTSWTTENAPVVAVGDAGMLGTTSAALMVNGNTNLDSSYQYVAGEYNGSTWSAVNQSNWGRDDNCAFGTQTAGVNYGGNQSGQYRNWNEEYNGTSWTAVTNYPEACYPHSHAAVGTQTDGFCLSGESSANDGRCTSYDGTSFTTEGYTNRSGFGKSKMGGTPSSATLGHTSWSTLTEEWDGTSWTTTGATSDNPWASAGGSSDLLLFADEGVLELVDVGVELGNYFVAGWPYKSSDGNVTSFVLDFAHAEEGDIMLAIVVKDDDVAATISGSGWTLEVGGESNNNIYMQVWSKTAGVDEEDYTISQDNEEAVAMAVAVSGGDDTSIAVSAITADTTIWAISPAVTPPTDNALIISVFGADGDSTPYTIVDRLIGQTTIQSSSGSGSAGMGYGIRVHEWERGSWATISDITYGNLYPAAAGTVSAAAFFGGNGGTAQKTTYEWDSSSWSTGGVMTGGRYGHYGSGTQTAALTAGGYNQSRLSTSEEYNGTSWSAGGALSTGTEWVQNSIGTQTAGFLVGGATSAGDVSDTFDYNGTAWSAGASLLTANRQVLGAGTQTSALTYKSGDASEWNGTSWETSPSSTDASLGSMSGASSDALLIGGGPTTPTSLVYHYNGSTWARAADLITSSRLHAAAGSVAGGTISTVSNGNSKVAQEYTDSGGVSDNTGAFSNSIDSADQTGAITIYIESGTVPAPVLTLPTETSIGSITATVGCTTDVATGTMYWYVSTSATAPTAAILKAGTSSVDFGSQASPGTGTETFAVTGLSAGITYYTYFIHTGDSDSNLLESGSWVTLAAPVLTLPTETAITNDSATVGCTVGSNATGTLYWFVSTSATAPTTGALVAGTGATAYGNTTGFGAGTETFGTGATLDAGTPYYTYFYQVATGSDDTSILESGVWNTTDDRTVSCTTEVLYWDDNDALVIKPIVGTTEELLLTVNAATITLDTSIVLDYSDAFSGDVLLAILTREGTASITQVGTDFTLVSGVNSGTEIRTEVWKREATGSETTNKWDVTDGKLIGHRVRLPNVTYANMLSSTMTSGTDATVEAPTITPNAEGDTVITGFGNDQDRSPYTLDPRVTTLSEIDVPDLGQKFGFDIFQFPFVMTADATMSSNRIYHRAVGTATSLMIAGGGTNTNGTVANSLLSTEEYNGTSWSGGGNTSDYRNHGAAAGTQTASYIVGGYTSSPEVHEDTTEEYNGTSWTSVNNMVWPVWYTEGCGTQTAGLVASGQGNTYTGGGDGDDDHTYEYDGTTWTTSATTGYTRCLRASVDGTQTSAILAGGGALPGSNTNSYEYNGTAWSSGGSISKIRHGHLGSASNSSDAWIGGGSNGSTTYFLDSEVYDGTSWAASNDLNFKLEIGNGNSGPVDAALSGGINRSASAYNKILQLRTQSANSGDYLHTMGAADNWTGFTLALRKKVNRTVNCYTESLELSDTDATVDRDTTNRTVTCSTESILWADNDATVVQGEDRTVTTTTEELSVGDNDATVFRGVDKTVTCATEVLQLADNDTTVFRGVDKEIVCTAEALQLSTNQGLVDAGRNATALTEALTIGYEQGVVNQGRSAVAVPEVLRWADNDATVDITTGKTVICTTEVLTLADNDTTIFRGVDRSVTSTTETLLWDDLNAQVFKGVDRTVSGNIEVLYWADNDSAVNQARAAVALTEILQTVANASTVEQLLSLVVSVVPSSFQSGTASVLITTQAIDTTNAVVYIMGDLQTITGRTADTITITTVQGTQPLGLTTLVVVP